MKLQWHQIMTMLRSMTPCLTGASADAAQQATENKWNFSGCRVFILPSCDAGRKPGTQICRNLFYRRFDPDLLCLNQLAHFMPRA